MNLDASAGFRTTDSASAQLAAATHFNGKGA
jgi:hypothetical protein